MKEKIINVFNAFTVKGAMPVLSLINVSDTSVVRTDLDRFLIYHGNAAEGAKAGLYEMKRTVIIPSRDFDVRKDFPKMPTVQAQATIKLDVTRTKGVLRRVLRYVSSDQARRAMHAMLLEIVDSSCFSMTASDGKRLYMEKVFTIVEPAKGKASKWLPLVTSNSLKVIESMITAEDDVMCHITLSKDYISFKVGRFELLVKNLDAEYPPVQQLMEEEKTAEDYEIVGLDKAVKFLDQFKIGVPYEDFDRETIQLYANKATMKAGQFDNIVVLKKGSVKVRGIDLDPCIIVLHIQNDDEAKGVIAKFHAPFLAEVASQLNGKIRMRYDKASGYAYFSKAESKW